MFCVLAVLYCIFCFNGANKPWLACLPFIERLLTTDDAVITIAIRLRCDYDPTTTYRARLLKIRRKQKMNMSIFRRSRIVIESQL